MKNLIVALVCAVLLSAAGLSAVPNDPQQEKQVLATMDRMGQAFVNKDIATLTKVLHNDLTWGHANGHVQTKDEVLKSASGPMTTEVFKFSEATVHIYGSTAVVRCSLETRTGSPTNPMQTQHFIVLLNLVKAPAGWQVVGEQRVHREE
jgi:hypothetical protein